MLSTKFVIFFLVFVVVAKAQEDDDGDYDGDVGAAQPAAGWGDGFFGGEGGDDEGFAAASGQAANTQGDQDTYSGSPLYGGSEGIGGLYGAMGVASNQKPVVKAAPKPTKLTESYRRSVPADDVIASPSSYSPQIASDTNQSLKRVRRGHGGHGHGVTGPIYTYIKTDYHGNFKWGARHNVGEHFHGKR